jgi:hypothetical protein
MIKTKHVLIFGLLTVFYYGLFWAMSHGNLLNIFFYPVYFAAYLGAFFGIAKFID